MAEPRARTSGDTTSGATADQSPTTSTPTASTSDTTTGVAATPTATAAPHADQTPAEQQQAAAAPPVSATAAGDDGTPRILFVAGMQDAFGPIELTGDDGQPLRDDNGDPVTYWLTRHGTEIAGAHVQKVRDIAAACHVPLRSEMPPEKAATSS